MRIVFIEIRNYRGIKELDWAPDSGLNCLVGPGDSTKTTILDAIELALNPRSYVFADDSDFFNLDVDNKKIEITITLAGLPSEFISEDRYGMYLRGWNMHDSKVEDEPGEGFEDALSIRVTVDRSLEAQWAIFNCRIVEDERDPPTIRYKDAKSFATTRLGPYAEQHLGWGRQSVLTRISEGTGSISLQLAQANRAAREAFRKCNNSIFEETVARAEALGRKFAVSVRDKYTAELDVQGIKITAGGIALHDGKLPLRRLGTGSARLIVSALQHAAGHSHIALIDELEHGLEPHRIARVLKHLKTPIDDENTFFSQIFMTTHSPVVIRELNAKEISVIRSECGVTKVRSVAGSPIEIETETVQGHLRSSPEAFLARRVLIGEGRTEQGLLRGFDDWWTGKECDSFALRGAVVIDGGGNTKAPIIAKHLLDLGYEILLLLDTDDGVPANLISSVKEKGGMVCEWPDACSTEERIFLDVSWETVRALVRLAESYAGPDSVLTNINNTCNVQSLSQIADLTLPVTYDTAKFRRAVGEAAKKKNWFKDITRGEQVATIIAPDLDQIRDTPLATTISSVRKWIDA